jgi:hypothetical protein
VLDATPAGQQAADFPRSPLLYYALAALVRDALTVRTWEHLNTPSVTIAVTQGTSIDNRRSSLRRASTGRRDRPHPEFRARSGERRRALRSVTRKAANPSPAATALARKPAE